MNKIRGAIARILKKIELKEYINQKRADGSLQVGFFIFAASYLGIVAGEVYQFEFYTGSRLYPLGKYFVWIGPLIFCLAIMNDASKLAKKKAAKNSDLKQHIERASDIFRSDN